jgi:hypothetical protein
VNKLFTEKEQGISYMLNPVQVKPDPIMKIDYNLSPSVDLLKIINQISQCFARVLNEISFCKFILAEELMRIKVTDKYLSEHIDVNEEAKKRFYKIEEIKHREILNLLMLFAQKSSSMSDIQTYINIELIKKNCFGNLI